MSAAPLRLPVGAAPTMLHDDAVRLFETISEAEQAGFHTAGPIATPSEAALHAITLAWPHAQVVSFDIFDTLVVRKIGCTA